MPRYEATIKAIESGVEHMKAPAAVKNIEGWEGDLESVEVSGIKTLVKDLENLKKHLGHDEIDSEAVHKLLAKLGKETVAIGGRADGKDAEKIKKLGEALTAASSHKE